MIRRRTVAVETLGEVHRARPRTGRQLSLRSTSTQHRHTSRRAFLSYAQTEPPKKIPRSRQSQTAMRVTIKQKSLLLLNTIPTVRVKLKNLLQNMITIVQVKPINPHQNTNPTAQVRPINLHRSMILTALVNQINPLQNMIPTARVKQTNLHLNTKKRIIQNLPYHRSPPTKAET